ncbi:uncharacterized protein CIMG_08642 [Coccidioides immitis RS]|uniref:DRBM domain-containing protein n=5 Tax=Coccidioides TaxID=5500 RepID=J3K5X6_COCIM|nr:uncharacterized protein CIMG_08642 [Coccidioides immitis RS]EFW17980.1 conserved hypothetical protein [Coccidioides posadasii str. Silveira]KMP06879.1 hypothetical protein CIRG_06560 [Coccidioides immitis RMSCC 2394]KMU75233.1 hypothetical protein CISG_04181 [Coccidioides immitis RMSCC 3703]KMU91380.1 hypothetical protein CIHG_09125 [Coccidioides immitis H538.4]TPX22252.1 hypothetical protein DIZ76_014120 [Coccidioides immitis]
MAAATVNGVTRPTWQEKLQDYCKLSQLPEPVFSLVSDRRGGRTAWSSSVTIQGTNFAARYFYDGQYLHNAKEDAAEVALTCLNSQLSAPLSTTLPGQLYTQNQQGNTHSRSNRPS